MTFATQLSERVCTTSFEDLPAEAVRFAKKGILDTLGVTLAGSGEPMVRILVSTLPQSAGASRILGTKHRASALDAALVNATAAHALDFDDCNNAYGGHPSAPIVPPLLALCDEGDYTGRELITAYVVGFEAECKIGRCDNYYQYSRGWHPTTTIGVFGAAAASARLLRLDRDQTATALAMAASMASGIKANFGTMTKPFQVGHCARNGLLAALLARGGFTANPAAFEHPQGFFEVFNGRGNYELLDLASAWGQPYDIVEPGIAFKQYPCCGSTHPAIDALVPLRSRIGADIGRIDRIDCAIHELCLKHTDRPDPQPGADAKFSLQYCLARALIDGTVTLADFSEERVRDPVVRSLMARVHVRPYRVAEFAPENYFGALVQVLLRDGNRFEGRVEEPLGCTSANPLPAGVLKRKFLECATRVLPARNAERFHDLGQALENVESVRAWTELLSP